MLSDNRFWGAILLAFVAILGGLFCAAFRGERRRRSTLSAEEQRREDDEAPL